MKYTLNVKETGNKAARYHYWVTDENGNVISERNSNRQYVACTKNSGNYFGRVDLAMKFLNERAQKLPAFNEYRRSKGLPEATIPDIAYLGYGNAFIVSK